MPESDKIYEFLTEFSSKIWVLVPTEIFILQTFEILMEDYDREKEWIGSLLAEKSINGVKKFLGDWKIPILCKLHINIL